MIDPTERPCDGHEQPLRVLSVTNMYPTRDRPAYGVFVRSQVDSLRVAGVRTDVLFVDGGRSPFAYVAAIPRIRAALRGASYDLVHAHYGLTGWLATKATGIPVIVSFCGDDLLGTPGRKGSPTFKSRFVMRLSRRAAACAAGVIVKSRDMLETLPATARDRGARVIPNGVDLALFSPRPRREARKRLAISDGETIVLFPHTPEVLRKRLDLARAAIAQLVARGVPASLRIVSRKPQEVLSDEYAAADCLLLTSDWEGSPNVVKEALAMNLPVVSVPCGDVAEWIEGLEGCALVPRETAAIAEGLARALAHGPLASGRERVAPIEIGRVARRVLALYRTVLES